MSNSIKPYTVWFKYVANKELAKGIYTKNSTANLQKAIENIKDGYEPQEYLLEKLDQHLIEDALAALEQR